MATSGTYSRFSRVTVLFVDDDADTRFAYQCIGAAEGLGVELAGDGHEAIALANVLLPDVIVLDVRLLPGLDGFEVVRRLRASARTRAIPIILVTGDTTQGAHAAARASGCEGHLVKPCSADALLRLVNALARSGRRATLEPRVAGAR
jgi:two-component system response regulator MprA